MERDAVEEAVRGITGAPPADVRFRDAERGRVALVTITLPGEQPLPSAHQHAGRIEEAVRERCPALADVIVHTEPGAGGRAQRRLIAADERDREQHPGVAEVARDQQDQGGSRRRSRPW